VRIGPDISPPLFAQSEERENSRRHTPAEWAEARRWVEQDGLTDEEAAAKLGVRTSTLRQRRYVEHWKPGYRATPPPELPAVPDSKPEPASAPSSRRQLVPPPPRDLKGAVQHDCGKWTKVSPCWHCKRVVAAA
jgi:hypothetical protein